MWPIEPLVFNIYTFVYTFPENLSIFLKTCQMIFDNSEEKKTACLYDSVFDFSQFVHFVSISHNLPTLHILSTWSVFFLQLVNISFITCPLCRCFFITCPLCRCFFITCPLCRYFLSCSWCQDMLLGGG